MIYCSSVTTLSFDIAGLELYLPLTVGARAVLVRREVAGDGIRLAKQLSDCGATVMQATPATWRMLLASGWPGNRELKILCGGEALSDDLAGAARASLRLVVEHVWPHGSYHLVDGSESAGECQQSSLGRPIGNTQVYILDAHLNPVPIGGVGEIHIGGDGLARGYLNRPELTAEKFIHRSFEGEPVRRLFRRGD